MSRSLRMALVLVCSLVIGLSAFAQTPTPASFRSNAEQAARLDGLKKLAASILDLKIDKKHSVKDFIKSTDLSPDDLRPMLQGAVHFPPVRHYGDGTCEIRVALASDRLQANLNRVRKEHYKKQDGEFAELSFDQLSGKKPIEAAGKATFLPWSPLNPAPPAGIPGWDGVSARDRIAAEKTAYKVALGQARAKSQELTLDGKLTVKDFVARSKAAAEALDSYFKAMRPESKAYLPDGIVEVNAVVNVDAFAAKLAAINEMTMTGKQKLDASIIAGFKQTHKLTRLTGIGYARADGKPFEPKSVSDVPVKLDLKEFVGISLE